MVVDPEEIAAALGPYEVEVVVLAGYMRILPRTVLEQYPDRVVNVHPSLLPGVPGATAVADALAYGVRVTGVTVHLVDEGVDTGPVVLQEAVDVSYDDTPSELLERLHGVERRLLPEAVRLIAAGRVECGWAARPGGRAPLKVKRALISVSNKNGLAAFAQGLHELGVELISTSGTATLLEQSDLPFTSVEEVTGAPEILGGRVKTLHPADPRRDPGPARKP